MNYALIDSNGVIENIIYLHPKNAHEFPNAILVDNIPVEKGDKYINGSFYRDNVKILTHAEELINTIAELDAALLNSTYENIIGGLE